MQHAGRSGHAAQLRNVLKQRQLLEIQRLSPHVKYQISIAWSLPRKVSAFPSLWAIAALLPRVRFVSTVLQHPSKD